MNVRALKLVFFSPTKTTRSIVQAVAQGLALNNTELVDVTPQEARSQTLRAAKDELLVAAMPVYGGRLPKPAADWLETLDVQGAPCVCLVVYGNRAYEDALLELKDIVTSRGGRPVACAAFVAEHSFSSQDTPIAVARPDEQDLTQAEAFGAAVRAKLDAAPDGQGFQDVPVPGNRPYKERKPPMTETFIVVNDNCTRCGLCQEICPVGAIDLEQDILADMDTCIRCCACIKACPEQARSMIKTSKMMEISQWLYDNCQERKEPEWFL